jgi:hypothetical protein
VAHPDQAKRTASPSGSDAWATTSIVHGVTGVGAHVLPAGNEIVTAAGLFGSGSPSPFAVAVTTCPRPSSTFTIALTLPGSLIVQTAFAALPEAQPDQAYVRASPSGSVAVAATSRVHENEPCGMHDVGPVKPTLTVGARFSTGAGAGGVDASCGAVGDGDGDDEPQAMLQANSDARIARAMGAPG